MRFGVNLPAFAELSDPHALADLAYEAERAGWDGFFIWDHIVFDSSWHAMLDPWVGLAAIAMRTERIKIGALLTPIPRRRPWKLARETATLDRLARGRLIMGVGIGDPAEWEYGIFGEPTDAKQRAEMLDEGLDVLTGLWSGEHFSYSGKHYQVTQAQFRPTPVQQPRIPIWVGGWWPNKPPMRRAARWDGVIPGKSGEVLSPDEWRAIRAYIAEHRTATTPFDAVHNGVTSGTNRAADAALVAEYADAGCTWWIEDASPWRIGLDWSDAWTPDMARVMRERVMLGPPRR